ncbi:ATPase, T2SS/T4P/T4SS family [Pseudomonas taiwanensis]|uniref:GspE/PulE family protein n=1 Tax=Pseudomonas taiwanensis TaxID=470150 RepID=UPI0028DE818C|nr:ATPase, T2SS/T4P/T4SS family [Pseudomonas taiwanensis]MDT8925003.1 ATPase, T2SS/T4P/T4SS family [Pseudomonas taiwanensis]
MNFFRRNKPKSVAPAAQVTAAPQNKASERGPTEIQNRGGEPPYKVISKKEDIPLYSAVLSISGGPVSLSPELQKNYAVLLVSQESKQVEVICTLDVIKRAGVDDEYMAIVDRLKRLGYVRARSKHIARPEILQIIYELTEQRRSQEEQQKAATEIQKSFDELLLRAVKIGASDIHMEVRRDQAQIRMRVNGDLGDPEQWAVRNANVMAGVIYMVIADEKETAFDSSRPQDAIIDRDLGDGVRIRVRLATLPAYPAGFDMIMRLLKMGQTGENIHLDKLGYNKEQLTKTRRAVAKPTGAIIMAGTTGSGKSTSLNAMLAEKIAAHDGRIKVITVEDPPEYLLNGATQVPVVRSRSAAKSGDVKENPFAAAVRATMRSDPDIIMVGEVRDHASAELLIHAVQSGHQVYTTTHAGSGIDIIARLRSQGIPDDVLGSQNFVTALMYQALLPVVCPHCSTTIDAFKETVRSEAEEELVARLYRHLGNNQVQNIRFRNYNGCPKCKKGVVGRTVASEVILPDAFMLKAFRDRQDIDAAMYHAYSGGKVALHHGIDKLIQGLVDVRDVETKLDRISALQEMQASVRHFVRVSGIENTLADASSMTESSNSESGIYVPSNELILPDPVTRPTAAPTLILPAHMAGQSAETVISLEKSPPVEPDTPASAIADVIAAPLPPAEVLIPMVPEAPEAEQAAASLVVNAQVRAPLNIAEEPQATAIPPALEEVVETESPVLTSVQVGDLEVPKPIVSEGAVEADGAVDAETQLDSYAPEAVVSASEPEVIAVVEQVAIAEVIPVTPELAAQEPVVAVPEVVQPEPLVKFDCEAAFLEALQAVLETEVARNGFNLSARFMKGRLSAPAIEALLSSDLVPEQQAANLQDAFGALNPAEQGRVFGLTIEEVQAFLDAKLPIDQSAMVADQVEATPSVEKPAAPAKSRKPSTVVPLKSGTAGKTRSRKPAATESPEATPVGANGSTAPSEETTVEAQAKPPRAYKSKLLAGAPGPTPEQASKDNVKSLDVARAQKTKGQVAAKAPGKTAGKATAKTGAKPAGKTTTKKPAKADSKDQPED